MSALKALEEQSKLPYEEIEKRLQEAQALIHLMSMALSYGQSEHSQGSKYYDAAQNRIIGLASFETRICQQLSELI